MEVVIDSVTTADDAPVAAPHRISNTAAKDTATVRFTPWDDGLLPMADTGTDADLLPSDDLLPGERPILAYRFSTSAVGAYAGAEVSHRGRVASESLVCSEGLVCEDFESSSGDQLTEQVNYAELGAAADGPFPVNVWVNYGGEWA